MRFNRLLANLTVADLSSHPSRRYGCRRGNGSCVPRGRAGLILCLKKEAVQLQSPRKEEHAAPPRGETADYSGEVYPAGLPLALYVVKRSAGRKVRSVQYCTL